MHLSGTLNCPASPGVAFTLPAGYRPSTDQLTTESNNTQTNWLVIANDGSVETQSADGICGLDGVTFPAGGTAGTVRKGPSAGHGLARNGAVR